MPSGKVHDRIAYLSIIPLLLIGLIKLTPVESLIFSGFALFSQLMFGPDLDINSKQYKRWGLFKWVWLPYMFIVPHRSRFSHGLILGPIFRCAYFTIIVVISLFFLGKLLFFLSNIDILGIFLSKFLHILNQLSPELTSTIAKPVIAGLFIGTAIHTLTDKINDFLKNLI